MGMHAAREERQRRAAVRQFWPWVQFNLGPLAVREVALWLGGLSGSVIARRRGVTAKAVNKKIRRAVALAWAEKTAREERES